MTKPLQFRFTGWVGGQFWYSFLPIVLQARLVARELTKPKRPWLEVNPSITPCLISMGGSHWRLVSHGRLPQVRRCDAEEEAEVYKGGLL